MARITDLPPEILREIFLQVPHRTNRMMLVRQRIPPPPDCEPEPGKRCIYRVCHHIRYIHPFAQRLRIQLLHIQLVNQTWRKVLQDTKFPAIHNELTHIRYSLSKLGFRYSIIYDLHVLTDKAEKQAQKENLECFCMGYNERSLTTLLRFDILFETAASEIGIFVKMCRGEFGPFRAESLTEITTF